MSGSTRRGGLLVRGERATVALGRRLPQRGIAKLPEALRKLPPLVDLG
ncbi:hypothetical protein ACFU8I_16290 [Streptomyces sp. NPDC057540]